MPQQMVPVYFQTSRWLRGYLEGPVFETGYGAVRAANYATQILGSMPNPAAAAVRKSGVSNQFLDFTYILAGWLQFQPNLLQASCGWPGLNGNMAGQNNGRTGYPTWQHAFSQLFANDPDFQGVVAGFPLFSIIDTNSAHHVSAPLVERAVALADPNRLAGAPNRAMLVINFDNHPDYGGDTNVPITCQNWGCFVSNNVANVYNHQISDAYVRFGANNPQNPNPDWSHGQWHQANQGGMIDIDPNHNSTLEAQINTVIAAISPGGAANVDAYVSLDRDVLKRSYTQYGDGPFAPANGVQGVKDCLTHLVAVGAHLAGVDICGLPTYPGASADHMGGQFTVTDATALAGNQIVDLWNFTIAL